MQPSPPVAQLIDGNDRATEAGSVEFRQRRDLSHGAARLQAAGQQLVRERRGVGSRWPREVIFHRDFDRSRRYPQDAGVEPVAADAHGQFLKAKFDNGHSSSVLLVPAEKACNLRSMTSETMGTVLRMAVSGYRRD